MKRQRLQKIPDVQILESRLNKAEYQLEAYRTRVDELKDFQVFKDLINNPMGKGLLSAVHSQVSNTKAGIIKDVDKVKNTSIFNAILDVLLNDAIAPSVVTRDIVKISSKNKKINDALKELQDVIDIDALAEDVAEDLITYGEYILGVKSEKGKGITGLLDNVEQSTMMAIYDGVQNVGFLSLDEKGKKVKVYSSQDYLHFCLGRRKLRIKVGGSIAGNKQGLRSEYIRIGRPLFHGNYNEVANLNLLSSLVPASYLHKINNTSLIGITVSGQTDPQAAFDICKKYNQILNKLQSFDSATGSMTVSDILGAAGKFKCVPIFSDDSRGRMEKMDPRFEEMTDISMIQELKKDICGSIGVPHSFIYGGDTPKGDMLKQFARYVRKLLSIQMAEANAFRRLGTVHCLLKGLTPAPNHIEVKFTNALISVDDLDKVEFLDMTSSTLSTISDSLSNISMKMQAPIDGKKLGEMFDKYLAAIEFQDVFKFPKKDIPPSPDLNAPPEEVPAEEEPA